MPGSSLKAPNFLDTGTAKELHFESLGGMALDLRANLGPLVSQWIAMFSCLQFE